MLVENPVLTGFNADPSIIRVGKDYYIATSTFEWFPGVQIHHSGDLAHWELLTQPLTGVDLRGIPSSGGIWAPCLSWYDGTFYLVYTIVRSYRGMYKDTHNYLVTAKDIMGPWSEPVYLQSMGFDPSLFHDEDGRKWLLSMRSGFGFCQDEFNGIVIQEYSEKEKKLVGKPQLIFRGTELGITEGPHIYKKDGWYYLMTAEGGTEFTHAVTLARSRSLTGPYETAPHNPILTSWEKPLLKLQKAGHASLVETPEGRWYLAHLASRPVSVQQMCILGRETSLQEVIWEDDWLKLSDGSNSPSDYFEITDDPAGKNTDCEFPDCNNQEKSKNLYRLYEDFEHDVWNLHLQSLRCPLGKRASLKEHPGWLRLYGGESPESCFEQSLLAHRQKHFYSETTVKMIFQPSSYGEMAGLIYYYDDLSYYYFYLTKNEKEQDVLQLLSCVMGRHTWPLGHGILLRSPEDSETAENRNAEVGMKMSCESEGSLTLWLRLKTEKELAHFYYSLNGEEFQRIEPALDAIVLSDDYYYKFDQYRFTGAFIGICCQDLALHKAYADFDFFDYREIEPE